MLKADEIKQRLPKLLLRLEEICRSIKIEDKIKELEALSKQCESQDLWNDPEHARKIMGDKAQIEKLVSEINSIKNGLHGAEELLELAVELGDENELTALETELDNYDNRLEILWTSTLLTGKHDEEDAIINIHAGAGGVDAMDWAQMLLRMYLRYCEAHGYKTTILDLQDDTEAGIKSASILVEGSRAYGYLRSEKGIHRLVRISPFNAAGKRQTSFASVMVIPQIELSEDVKIAEDDLRIDVYRSSGSGGQHVNTTESAVRITHIPTGIVVSCQNEKSQRQNKELALKVLKSRLMELKEQEKKESIEELKGDYSQITWGSQIRSYVFQPYTMVKDHRNGYEEGNVDKVMDGQIDGFIQAQLKFEARKEA